VAVSVLDFFFAVAAVSAALMAVSLALDTLLKYARARCCGGCCDCCGCCCQHGRRRGHDAAPSFSQTFHIGGCCGGLVPLDDDDDDDDDDRPTPAGRPGDAADGEEDEL
jgi:hypothetical protein